jgi:hypothetical protein
VVEAQGVGEWSQEDSLFRWPTFTEDSFRFDSTFLFVFLIHFAA